MSHPESYQTVPQEFGSWLVQQIGEVKWIAARRSAKRIKEGYELFMTQTRLSALKHHFWKEHGDMEGDTISKHLTEPDLAFAQKRKDTHDGMAHWAGTGPAGKTCRTCARWQCDGYMASSGLLKDALCGKYTALMHGSNGARVPHFAKACKYFEPGEERPIEKPKTAIAR